MGVCTKERKGVTAEVLMATPASNLFSMGPGALSGWHIDRATWPSHVISIIVEYRRVFGLNDKQGYLAASGRNVRRAERKPHTNNVCIRRLKSCLSAITRFIIRPMAISPRMCVSRLVRGPTGSLPCRLRPSCYDRSDVLDKERVTIVDVRNLSVPCPPRAGASAAKDELARSCDLAMPLTFTAELAGALLCRERRGGFVSSDVCELLDQDRVCREG